MEDSIAHQISKRYKIAKEDVQYEAIKIHYTYPTREAKYTPDFILPNGIIVETKGQFIVADRKKHALIKEQHPELDIRFVFSNPNARISKNSRTTYAAWCEKHGFKYAKQWIPAEWFAEEAKGNDVVTVES